MPRVRDIVVLLVVSLLWARLPASAQHEGHMAPDPTSGYERSQEHYDPPDVTLVNQDGERVRLKEFLSQEKPVMLEFIFATCTTICPIMSAGFAKVQNTLANNEVQLVSVTIDPEHDTPEVLRKYSDRYQAQAGWDFLTGDKGDIDQTMHAFDVFVADKMLHRPITLIRASGGGAWTRINGLPSAKQLMREYRALRDN